MSYIYLLAGEDLELAQAELDGFLKSQKIDETSERDGKLAFTESEPSQLRRLALVHEIGEKIFEGDIENFEPDDLAKGSFKVRRENLTGQEKDKKIESKLGSMIESDIRKVDLENPDYVYKVYLRDKDDIIVRIVEDIDRSLFEDRSNEKRPFSSPVSLDPVLARVMVNLAEVPPGEHLIDPFCGTGGILIESGLCGIGVNGSDLSEEMVRGSRKNLEEYGVINHDIKRCDIEEAAESFDKQFSAVVTDLPYGQSSKIEGEPVRYFSENWSDFADRAVFCYDSPELNGMESSFEIYIHKNLTRYIYVMHEADLSG